jgi:hypothetical protein
MPVFSSRSLPRGRGPLISPHEEILKPTMASAVARSRVSRTVHSGSLTSRRRMAVQPLPSSAARSRQTLFAVGWPRSCRSGLLARAPRDSVTDGFTRASTPARSGLGVTRLTLRDLINQSGSTTRYLPGSCDSEPADLRRVGDSTSIHPLTWSGTIRLSADPEGRRAYPRVLWYL